MKWVLIILVLGTTPVKTDLVFDSLRECLAAEDQMRSEYVRAFNEWLAWARQNPEQAGYPESEEFMMKRIGAWNFGTCIPTRSSDEDDEPQAQSQG